MISIDQSILNITPHFRIGVIEGSVTVNETQSLDGIIDEQETLIKRTYTLQNLLKNESILKARNAYKAYGKDPSRYRLAVESLYRRLIKGNHLYRINDVVDIGNILSLKFACSTAVLDHDKISGHIRIRLGNDEPYEGIGRGNINISNIPVYVDDIGPFGSTTSDTNRTKITLSTKRILVFIISFNSLDNLSNYIQDTISIYKTYTDFQLDNFYVIKNND
jgi:DNA/RNA-binding domain of Phe-tRNA-synthetase-like protein